MTKTEAELFRNHWKVVHTVELKELRRTSPLIKIRQLNALMTSVEELGWKRKLRIGESEVRNRSLAMTL